VASVRARASECLALLSPWYVHADDELNAEFNAIKIALDGIEEAGRDNIRATRSAAKKSKG